LGGNRALNVAPAGSDTTADVMDLLLAKDARTLDRLEATGGVHAIMKDAREARGDRLVYEAREDLYQLWGKPLTLTNRESDGTCYAQEGTMARFKDLDSFAARHQQAASVVGDDAHGVGSGTVQKLNQSHLLPLV
jgi:hypothetical protein